MTERTIDKSTAITRTICPQMDEILGWSFPVLDKGFMRVIDYMGDQAAIVQMARTSYGAGTKTIREDVGLIRHLMRHRHTSPFEGCEIKFHVKLPIFVARQWIRHRMASVNEYSARYSIMKDEFFLPDPSTVLRQSASNKQGAEGELPEEVVDGFLTDLTLLSAAAFQDYSEALKKGVSREQARIGLPLNTYTEWYWKVDLHNLINFLSLRADKHAQYEIRVYAELMLELLRRWMPDVAVAVEDYRLNAHSFSGPVLKVLREYLADVGEIEFGSRNHLFREIRSELAQEGIKDREINEVMQALGAEGPINA